MRMWNTDTNTYSYVHCPLLEDKVVYSLLKRKDILEVFEINEIQYLYYKGQTCHATQARYLRPHDLERLKNSNIFDSSLI